MHSLHFVKFTHILLSSRPASGCSFIFTLASNRLIVLFENDGEIKLYNDYENSLCFQMINDDVQMLIAYIVYQNKGLFHLFKSTLNYILEMMYDR
jgi:hypothetical protein